MLKSLYRGPKKGGSGPPGPPPPDPPMANVIGDEEVGSYVSLHEISNTNVKVGSNYLVRIGLPETLS